MGSLSYYAAGNLLDLTLTGDPFTSPATVYLGWFTTPPSADGTATEVTGGGYARQAITFDPAADGNVVSAAAVTWATFNAAADTMLAGWGIFDAATAGNLLAYGRTPSYVIPLGQPFGVPAGAITINSDDTAMSDYLADAWLDHLFNNTAYSNPATVYLGHYTVTPTATTSGTEVSDAGYARQAADWDVAANGASALLTTVSWLPLTTSVEQTLTGWALLDASTAGNVLWFYNWPETLTVPGGDTVFFAAGSVALKAAA